MKIYLLNISFFSAPLRLCGRIFFFVSKACPELGRRELHPIIISRALFLLLQFILPGLLLFCAENSNPVIENTKVESAPVSGLNFLPHRKYITISDSNSIQIKGLKKIFECSQINSFGLKYSKDTIAPDISLELPQELDKCGVAGSIDTVIRVVREDWEKTTGKIYLAGSGMKVTDSVILTEMGHGKTFLYLDTNASADMVINNTVLNSIIEGKIKIECGDSLSYAAYCRAGDTLFIGMALTSGWNAGICDSVYTYIPENEVKYFHQLTLKPDRGCVSLLDSLGYGN